MNLKYRVNKMKKVIIERTIKCPWCNKFVDVKHTKEIIREAVKGEYEEEIEVFKSEQTTLGE